METNHIICGDSAGAHGLFVCANCGKQFRKQKTRTPGKRHFCNRRCFHEYLREQVPIVTCDNCGKGFRRSPALNRGKHAFCSRECRKAFFTVTGNCDFCGVAYSKRRSEFALAEFNHYCCKECADRGMEVEKPILACDWCGDSFERYPSEVAKAARRGHRFVFCCHTCRAAMVAAQFDESAPYTKPHTSSPRNSAEDRAWRRAVLGRDDYTCQDCGTTIKMLAAHHVKPVMLFPELRVEVSNGTTLCYQCHTNRHSYKEVMPNGEDHLRR